MSVYTYINDLEKLECILDQLVFEEEESIFTDENTLDLIETALHLMDEYMSDNPTLISEPDFHDILLEEIQKLFYVQLEEHILNAYDDSIEDDLEELIEIAFDLYSTLFSVERSFLEEESDIDEENDDADEEDREKHKVIESTINRLRNIPQPVQRTEEWYQFRHNLITASNAYKAFESQSMINQLIYEKCQPLKPIHNELSKDAPVSLVNTETTLHWGQKYEPLSVMFYEKTYQTKVEDFGCIRHSVYHFIGASPDGIVVDKKCDRYGRMLEIKNIVNREINGIPKKEYWIQMQLQMEVCDLDECDFLETKFVEYPNSQSYYEDHDVLPNMKGLIIHFHTKEGKPYYEYKPLHITDTEDISLWEETTIEEKEKDTEKGYVFLKTIYWKLEKWSCVFVKRNREWFQNNISQLQQVWQTIEYERIHGYEHRAPKKKIKREKESTFVNEPTKCLLSFSQIDKNK